MKKLRKSKNIIRIWILTYICILLIPTVANIIISYYFTNGMNEEIENYNKEYLSKIATDVDNLLLENILLTQQLSENKLLREIAAYDSIGNAEYRRVYDFLNSGLYNYFNRTVEDMCIYLKNSGAMLTKGAFAEKRLAYEIFPLDESVGEEEWQRLVTNSYNHTYMQLGDNLYEIHTLFFGTDYEVNVFIKFGKSYFHWKGSELFPEGANIMICEPDGDMVYSVDETASFDKLDFAEDMGVLTVKSGSDSNMVCYLKSNVSNWIYLMSVPRTEFYANTNNMQVLELVVLLVFLAIGIAVIILVSVHNFKPLRKIISDLGGEPSQSGYDFIESSINRISYKYDDMSRRNLVSQLLMNSLAAHSSEGLLSDYGITVSGKVSAVVMTVNSGGDMIDPMSNRREVDAFYGALENVFTEIASEHGFGTYFTSCDGVMSVLVDMSGDISLTDLLIKLDGIYESVLGVKCTLCCGSIEPDISRISSSFGRAKQVLSLMHFMGEVGVGCYSEKMSESLRTGEKELNVLRVAILNGDTDTWSDKLRELFSFGIQKPRISDIRLVMYDISRLLLELCKEKHISTAPEGIRSIAEAESFDGFIRRMQDIAHILNTHTEEEADEIDNIAGIKSFVAENYKNSELSNQMIAEHIGFSVNYVSKYFKKQTGEGLLEYITRVRVEDAKRLLAQTDKTIGEIAVEVGFYNALALIRAYKKVEGITPTQYRAIKDK
ncbi:MAG: helix-turn-helix transcriptional regulator [Clostridia bacterium]|nr:helix-turn-helix transcriptional regulator [Clostridia bacterium]